MPPPFARAAPGTPQTAAFPPDPRARPPEGARAAALRGKGALTGTAFQGAPRLRRVQAGRPLRLRALERRPGGSGDRNKGPGVRASFPRRPWLGVGRPFSCTVPQVSAGDRRAREADSTAGPPLGSGQAPDLGKR